MSNVPAGWYESTAHPGHLQWWDGNAWGPVAPPSAPVSVTTNYVPLKSKGVAYLFLLLLGGLGAHRFYLGQVGGGLIYLALYVATWVSIFAAFRRSEGIGLLFLATLVLALFVELFVLAGSVDRVNRRILESS